MAAVQPLHAQTTNDPVYLVGVVGETTLTSTQGVTYVFPETARPTQASVEAHAAFTDTNYLLTGTVDLDGNYINLAGTVGAGVTAPEFLVGTLELRDGTTVVGTQELYVVVFAEAAQRDAFLYYVSQLEQSVTEEDTLYWNTFVSYQFWIGQEDEATANFVLYVGLGQYYYLTTLAEDPQLAGFYYYYYYGVGAYLYFEGIGDSEFAVIAWNYYYDLAVQAYAGVGPTPQF